MSKTPVTFDDLIRYGTRPYWGSPQLRAAGSLEIPLLIASRLADNAPPEQRQAWVNRLINDHWPRLIAERAGAVRPDWLALVAGYCVGVALLTSVSSMEHLPEPIRHVQSEPELKAMFTRLLLPLERHILLVDGERVFSARTFVKVDLKESTEDRQEPDRDPALRWNVDSDTHQGRSHTLLLALLKSESGAELELPRDRPLAASGETSGDRILPVGHLAEKRRHWFESHPDGLLITAPPFFTEVEEWKKLTQTFGDGRYRSSRDNLAPPASWKQWLTAGSLVEARHKLERFAAAPFRSDKGIATWDGHPLAMDEIIPLDLEWVDDELNEYSSLYRHNQHHAKKMVGFVKGNLRGRTEQSGALSKSRKSNTMAQLPGPKNRPVEQPLSDPLLDACWNAKRNLQSSSARTTIVVLGAPGCGKSIWSQYVERCFEFGPLGALGTAVRRGARQFAADIQRSGADLDLPSILSLQHPDKSELYFTLHATRRLFLIIDGLDEVDGFDLTSMLRLVQHAECPVILFSRPTLPVDVALPHSFVLQISPLASERGRLLLVRMGRSDLASQLFGDNSNPRESESIMHPELQSVVETPLHLALLARVVRTDERIEDVDQSALYRRTYNGLVRQALSDQRLTREQADILERSIENVVGGLALEWLKAPEGVITRVMLSAHLEDAGFKGRDAIDIERALEFGYLLAPGAGQWEFSHRTLAEWAAAEALAHQVQREIHRRRRTEKLTRAQLAEIEQKVLDELLATPGPRHASSWSQVLRFYTRHLQIPEVLLERLIGPEGDNHLCLEVPRDERRWTSSVHNRNQEWHFAFELMSNARWSDPTAAMHCWAFLVRAAVLTGHKAPFHFDSPAQRLIVKLGVHLPRRLESLLDLVARTPEQRRDLETRPTALLPYCAADSRETFEPLLREDRPVQQTELLNWYEKWHMEAPSSLLFQLVELLPPRILAAQKHEAVVRERANAKRAQERLKRERHSVACSRHELAEEFSLDVDEGPESVEAESIDIYLLEREESSNNLKTLETAVWRALLRQTGDLPWKMVRARLEDWPHHLSKILTEWFQILRNDPRVPGDEQAINKKVEIRRRALSLLVTNVTGIRKRALETLSLVRAHPQSAQIAAWLHERTSTSENDSRSHFMSLAQSVGWKISRSTDHRRPEGSELLADTMLDLTRAENSSRFPLSFVVRSMSNQQILDKIVGGLWTLLPPESDERETLLAALMSESRMPSVVDLDAILSLAMPDDSLIPYDWCNRFPWQPSHVARWKELAEVGIGRKRFIAIQWCASVDKSTLKERLLSVFDEADAEFKRLAAAQIDSATRYDHTFHDKTPAPSDISLFSLSYRASHDLPGWRQEVLGAIQAPTPEGLKEALRLIKSLRVTEALPMLMAMYSAEEALNDSQDYPSRDESYYSTPAHLLYSCSSDLEDTIAALIDQDDRKSVRSFLQIHGRRHGRFPAHLPNVLLPTDREEALYLFQHYQSASPDDIWRFLSADEFLLMLEWPGPPTHSRGIFRSEPIAFKHLCSNNRAALRAALDKRLLQLADLKKKEESDDRLTDYSLAETPSLHLEASRKSISEEQICPAESLIAMLFIESSRLSSNSSRITGSNSGVSDTLLERLPHDLVDIQGMEHRYRSDRDIAARQIGSLNKWISWLKETLLQTLQPCDSLQEIVDIGMLALGGDVHDVTWSFGPLGSDFDDFGDREYESHQVNAGEVGRFVSLIEEHLKHQPMQSDLLAQLFWHPSETLKLRLFEALTARVPPHQIAKLAIQAMEGHLHATDTQWSGDTGGLMLASMSRGAYLTGSINIEPPKTTGKLFAAVRRHLTHAHKGDLELLLEHTHPALRVLACRWIGEIGTNEWSTCLAGVLSDPSPWVVRAAIEAWLRLDLESLDRGLSVADRAGWSGLHYSLLWATLSLKIGLSADDGLSVGWGYGARKALHASEPSPILSGECFLILLLETCRALAYESGERPRSHTLTRYSCPTMLEQLFESAASLKDIDFIKVIPSSILLDFVESGRGELCAPLRRILARLYGAGNLLALPRLLSSSRLRDRVSAAECLMLDCATTFQSEVLGVWEACFPSATNRWEQKNQEEDPEGDPTLNDEEELRDRLIYALKQSPVAFVPLLRFIVEGFSYDEEDNSPTERTNALFDELEALTERWISLDATEFVNVLEKSYRKPEFVIIKALSKRAVSDQAFERWLEMRSLQGSALASTVLDVRKDETKPDRNIEIRNFLMTQIYPIEWTRPEEVAIHGGP